ncbi:hypothetical protein GCM10022251_64760 [Phytohabitans flavus]|uniref:Uncharacterized protein n=1 Tax=Phytohabitans flavus TaxID=1076124 RepID=A0A6F8XUB3_9ACTN|nr:hypothetical protein [Phytohabitans flavus]BCB77331.1 hypothetical protein Pflav_037410 [Phytohabitans flavus]
MDWFLRALAGGRSGRLPDQLRAELAATDLLVLEEELLGTVTYRRYRSAREYTSWSREPAAGAIALAPNRLVVWANHMRHIDVPLAHPIWATIEVRAERPGRVRFTYDAGATNTAASGHVDVRLRTPQAERIVQLLSR